MRSIYRSKEYANIIDRLSKTKNPDTGTTLFSTIKELQCFAAVLGFNQKRRSKLDRSNVENIEWHIFENTKHSRFIYLIALAETNDLNVLKYDVENFGSSQDSEDMVEIFEEYSNGGFEIIKNWLSKTPSDPYGDKAILVAMEKMGFMNKQTNTFPEVEF